MSIPRRLGRLARGFVLNLQDDDRLKEALRVGRERGETFRETFGEAFGAAWKGAAEEWRAAEEEQTSDHASERTSQRTSWERDYRSRAREWRERASTFTPRKYPLAVLKAYQRLGLDTGASVEEVRKKRRELIKRYHPDRFSDPDKRVRAEKLAAEINAAHDTIVRHLLRGK